MKKFSSKILLFVLCGAVLACACSKSDVDSNSGTKGKTVTLSATINDGGTKANLVDPNDGTLKVYWSATDQITVVNTAVRGSATTFTTSGNSGTSKGAKFTGSLSSVANGNQLYAYYPTTSNVSLMSGSANYDVSAQGGTIDYVKSKMVMGAEANYYDSQSTVFTFSNICAILKITITMPYSYPGYTLSSLTINSGSGLENSFIVVGGSYQTSMGTGAITATLSSSVPLSGPSNPNDYTFYVIVPPQSITSALTLSAHTEDRGDYGASTTTTSYTFEAGKLYTINKELTHK